VPGNVRSMSRGVVLWPDDDTSRVVANLWALLEAEGVPTLATHTHRQHRPHVSLVVADDLLPSEALDVLESVPLKTLHLLVSGPGIFPGGILFLACVPNAELLEEQRRVHDLVAPMTKALWDYFVPGAWSPHLTISYGLDGSSSLGPYRSSSIKCPSRGGWSGAVSKTASPASAGWQVDPGPASRPTKTNRSGRGGRCTGFETGR
jgi:hypothetical protein